MNKTYSLIFLFLFLATYSAKAQPKADWSLTYGGYKWEENQEIILSPDGGFLAIGASSSEVDADSTKSTMRNPAQGEYDVIAVKVSSSGKVEWEKRIGGLSRDIVFDGILDSRNRYVLVGESFSSKEGTKTSDREGPGSWVSDVFAICLDLNGNEVWQKSFGGVGFDNAKSVIEVDNGNYLIFGETTSPADPSTSRKLPLKGTRAFWKIEVDPDGHLVNENVYGGDFEDNFWKAIKLKNGEILITGASQSTSGFDRKLQGFGSSDFWVLRLNQRGSILQEYIFGGDEPETPFNLIELKDGGVLVAGQTLSGVSGNKTTPKLNPSQQNLDLWVVKFDLQSGDIIWDKTFGGDFDDNAFDVAYNVNDFILFAGSTKSPVRGNVTSVINGESDGWMLFIDPNGNVLWDINRGGVGGESIRSIVSTGPGEWFIGGESSDGYFDWRTKEAGGPYGELYSTNVRANDMWLAKLVCDFKVELGPPSIELCDGDSVRLTNIHEHQSKLLEYYWSDQNTDSIRIITPTEKETYILTSLSVDACQSRDTVTLFVAKTARIDLLDAQAESCKGAKDGFIHIEPNAETIGYYVNGVQYTGNTTINEIESGQYFIRVKGKFQACVEDTTFVLKSTDSLLVNIGPDREAEIGSKITLNSSVSPSEGDYQYKWEGVDGDCNSCPNFSFDLAKPSIVSVTVIDENGCTGTDYVTINAIDNLNVGIPNAFSPNNDGVNDYFFLRPSFSADKIGPLRIYDRWGNEVFVGVGDQVLEGQGWNGEFNGEPLKPGVYVYSFQVVFKDGLKKFIQGEINLVR